MKPRAKDIIICLFWWLTFSIVFPYQTKKRGLIRSRWGRILLTLISPAAMMTYLIVWLGFELGKGPAFDPDQAPFRTSEEIELLTGIENLPGFVRIKSYHDGWEGWTRIRYAYSDSLSDVTKTYLEESCSEKDNPYWTRSEASDTSFYGPWKYTFSRGWLSEVVEKPDDCFPDNMSVTISFGEKGFDVTYHAQGPFYFKDWMSREQLKTKTGFVFPDFDVVNYEWIDHFMDCSAIMTIRFSEVPGHQFIQQLEAAGKWSEVEDGFFFQTPIDENTRDHYTIQINRDSRIAVFRYDSF